MDTDAALLRLGETLEVAILHDDDIRVGDRELHVEGDPEVEAPTVKVPASEPAPV